MDDRERYAHIGRTIRRAAQDRLNPVSLEPFTEQKLLFYDYCRASGIPVPEVYGTAGRLGGWSRLTGRVICGRDEFSAFLATIPGDMVVKPSFGNRGEGVRGLTRSDGGLTDLDGSPVDAAVLHDEICADPDSEIHVVQERMRNHPAIEEITASPVLQTLRVSTIVRPDGSVLVLGVLRLALSPGATDNWHYGEAGNGWCPVSLDDGELGQMRVRAPEVRRIPTVPGTGAQVCGRRIPLVEEACRLVRRAALLFLPMRTLGWDVALTPDGPVVIEANNWWSPFRTLSAEAWALLVGDDRAGPRHRGLRTLARLRVSKPQRG